MPRLVDRATGTLGDIAPKAVGLLSVTGFAAAGVVSVIAENLRTLADREEALPDRAKQVAQNSVGAVLAGPSALSQRGRQLVGKDEASGNGAGTSAHRAGTETDRGGTAPKPAERPTRSKPEEAQVRDGSRAGTAGRDDRETGDRERQPEEAAAKAAAKAKEQARRAQERTEATAETAADTVKSAADKAANAVKGTADTAKDTAKSTADKAKDTAKRTADRSEDRAEEATAKARDAADRTAAKAKKAEEQASPATTSTAKSTAAEATAGTADPDRSVEEQRAAQKAAKKAAGGKKGGNGQDADEAPAGVPADVDEHLVADLQRMTVKQLRDRAAQDGVPGRSDMNKAELVVALATRETDDVPAKA